MKCTATFGYVGYTSFLHKTLRIQHYSRFGLITWFKFREKKKYSNEVIYWTRFLVHWTETSYRNISFCSCYPFLNDRSHWNPLICIMSCELVHGTGTKVTYAGEWFEQLNAFLFCVFFFPPEEQRAKIKVTRNAVYMLFVYENMFYKIIKQLVHVSYSSDAMSECTQICLPKHLFPLCNWSKSIHKCNQLIKSL